MNLLSQYPNTVVDDNSSGIKVSKWTNGAESKVCGHLRTAVHHRSSRPRLHTIKKLDLLGG
jgi:hypothetical protein